MTPDQAKALREPFPPEAIGKLPRVWCAGCRDNKAAKHCADHKLVKCLACRQSRVSEAHLHLDFVGHAEATDRLLQVDPEWTWEPMGFTGDGLPAMTGTGLWIRLTIAGVTRPGYGDAGDKRGGDAMKEAIGDAIRNAAMRFGVALDLWGTSFKDSDPVVAVPAPEQPVRPAPEPVTSTPGAVRKAIAAAGATRGMDVGQISSEFFDWSKGEQIGTCSDVAILEEYLKHLSRKDAA